ATALLLALAAAALVMAVGIVATSSRTGILGVALLALWGMLDRRLERRARVALLALPVAVAAAWLSEARWARAHGVAFTLVERVSNDPSSFRFNIWHDALQLIAQNPWTGVGWGNFNFAWTLSPFGFRPEGPTDNAHDLALQLAVEHWRCWSGPCGAASGARAGSRARTPRRRAARW
ncbi:MAG TPA: O-antigen ligase family protein, partial [Burkholderiaceae bacterium]